MNKILVVLIAALGVIAVLASYNAYAHGPNAGRYTCPFVTKSAEESEIINDTCPVFVGKVDKGAPHHRLRHKDGTAGFCHAGRAEAFRPDCEKHMEN